MPAQAPYSSAAAAAALWQRTSDAACLSACTPAGHGPSVALTAPVPPGAVDASLLRPIHEPRVGNYGGLTPEVNAAPFYDPRAITTRAPNMAVPGAVVSTPALAHGPDAFDASVAPAPRPQYAPQGPLPMQPLLLTPLPGSVPCFCVNPRSCQDYSPYSLATLMLTPANVLHVRNLMEAAGLVVVSPALRAVTAMDHGGGGCCACRVMGDEDLYAGFAAYALQNTDASIAMLPDPVQQAAMLDARYVDGVLGGVRNQVITASQANYARVEGARAYLQPLPQLEDGCAEGGADGDACCWGSGGGCGGQFTGVQSNAGACGPGAAGGGCGTSVCAGALTPLPSVLPGTGMLTTPLDSRFAARALADPRGSARNRAVLSCEAALPIGALPTLARVPPPPPAAVGPVPEASLPVVAPLVPSMQWAGAQAAQMPFESACFTAPTPLPMLDRSSLPSIALAASFR